MSLTPHHRRARSSASSVTFITMRWMLPPTMAVLLAGCADRHFRSRFCRSFLPGTRLQIANAVRLAIRSVDETLPIYRVVPMNEYVAATMANRRLALVLLGSFAAIALFCRWSESTALRNTRWCNAPAKSEIRMALGAQNHHVLRLMLRQASRSQWAACFWGDFFPFALMDPAKLVFGRNHH